MTATMSEQDLCPWSDLPRDFCAHCHPSRVTTLAQLERLLDRKLPEYTMQTRPITPAVKTTPWHVGRDDPQVINCTHGRTGNAQLCGACTAAFVSMLVDVPSLTVQLELAAARQVSFVDRGVTSRDDQAPPHPWVEVLDESDPAMRLPDRYDRAGYARPAARAYTRLHRALRGVQEPPDPGWLGTFVDPTQLTVSDLAVQWVRGLRDQLLQPDAGGRVRRITKAIVLARQVIERPEDLRFIGPCPNEECGSDVYADTLSPNATADDRRNQTVQCDDCGTVIRVGGRIRDILDDLDDRLMTAAELVGAISNWGGEPVTRNQINWWAKTKQLKRHTRDVATYPELEPGDPPDLEWSLKPGRKLVWVPETVFKLGDVRDLAATAAARKAERDARPADH